MCSISCDVFYLHYMTSGWHQMSALRCIWFPRDGHQMVSWWALVQRLHNKFYVHVIECAWVTEKASHHMIEMSFWAAHSFLGFSWVPWIKWLRDGKSFVLMMMASLAVETRARSGDGKKQMTSCKLILCLSKTTVQVSFTPVVSWLTVHMLITILWGFMITNQDDLALCWSLSRKYLVLWKEGLLRCFLQKTKNYMIWARLVLSCFHVSVLNCCCEWFVLAFCFVLVSNIIWCHIKLGFLKQIKIIYVQWCPGRNDLATVVCNLSNCIVYCKLARNSYDPLLVNLL